MKDHRSAPRTSQLGWDMDHIWLLREMSWDLQGEWRTADGRWMPLCGHVVVEDGLARWILDDEEAPQRSVTIHPGGGNRAITRIDIQTESVSLSGTLRSFGARQDLTAFAGSWNLAETALQRADGSVEIDGIFTRLGEVRDAWRWVLRPRPLNETWRIPRRIVEEMIARAKEGAPIEQCGLLVGVPAEHRVTSHIPMTNADQSVDHFTMDPTEQFRAAKSLRGTSTEIVGAWHSHPYSPARLSDEDVSHAHDETALHGLVSLMEPENPAFQLFRVVGGRVSNLRIELVDDMA
ncbi:MAG: M67 family metallopeptidase [Fibrobacteria bacterium]|nr:M67 family metallopeptidase [Fibrobacteria bacterium]